MATGKQMIGKCFLALLLLLALGPGCLFPASAQEPILGERGRPLKVAYLHYGLDRGGIERHILNLVRGFDAGGGGGGTKNCGDSKGAGGEGGGDGGGGGAGRVVFHGVDATVVMVRRNASLAFLPGVSALARRVVAFPASRLEEGSPGSAGGGGRVVRERAGFGSLVRFLKRSSFDVAFSFYAGGPDDLVGVDAAAIAGVPTSVVYVGWTLAVPPGLPIDALELPSDVLLRIQQDAASPYSLVRIDSPVDFEAFDPARYPGGEQFCESGLGCHAARRLVVGRVSRLVSAKAPEAFVLAARRVKDELLRRHYAAQQEKAADLASAGIAAADGLGSALPLSPPPLPRFLLGGDGVLRAALERLVREEGVEDMVEFVGRVTDVPRFLSGLDIFLYPTFGDSFGYVVAEAMAMRLPVVSNQVGSLPELVETGVSGYLAPLKTLPGGASAMDDEVISELAAHVLRLLADPALRDAMGAEARAKLLKSKSRGDRGEAAGGTVWNDNRSLAAFADAHAELYARILVDNCGGGGGGLGTSARADPAAWANLATPRLPWLAEAKASRTGDSAAAAGRQPERGGEEEGAAPSRASEAEAWWGLGPPSIDPAAQGGPQGDQQQQDPRVEDGQKEQAGLVDGVYVINLDRSPGRLQAFEAEAARHGLGARFTRVQALDGRDFVRVVSKKGGLASRGARQQGEEGFGESEPDVTLAYPPVAEPPPAAPLAAQGASPADGVATPSEAAKPPPARSEQQRGGEPLRRNNAGPESVSLLLPGGLSVRFLNLESTGPQSAWRPGNLAVSLSHLVAIKAAFDRGDRTALILEDDVRFLGPTIEASGQGEDGSEGGGGGDGLPSLAALGAAASDLLGGPQGWSVLQLGYVPEVNPESGLPRLVTSWERGLALVPRLPCGNADWRTWGLHAYLVSRAGMRRILDAWWPGSSQANACFSSTLAGGRAGESSLGGIGGRPEESTCAVGQGPLEFDLRLAGRVFSEAIILNVDGGGVFTATKPLFSLRGVSSVTDRAASKAHSDFLDLGALALDQAFALNPSSPAGAAPGGVSSLGIEFPPPPVDTSAHPELFSFHFWGSPSTDLLLSEQETHGPPWARWHQCNGTEQDSPEFPKRRQYCAAAAYMIRSLRHLCLASGLARGHAFDAPDHPAPPLPSGGGGAGCGPFGSLAAAAVVRERVGIILYNTAGQPQVFTVLERHFRAGWTAKALARRHCVREARLPEDTCARLAPGLEFIAQGFADSLAW